MKTVVIGDVHGCIDEFKELVGMFGPSDKVIQLGDLMDRGPAPAECVKFAKQKGILVVASNHDDKHVRWRRHEKRKEEFGTKNPMKPFSPDRMEEHRKLSDEEVDWLSKCPHVYMLQMGGRQWAFVHGGLENVRMDAQDKRRVIRVRYVDRSSGLMVPPDDENPCEQPENSVPWYVGWTGSVSVAFGHMVVGRRPLLHETLTRVCLGVDTGCVYGGALTAAVIRDDGMFETFVSVPAKKLYYDVDVPAALRE